ncbi:NAD-dependent epimerase/dehydratase family protein [Rhodobacter capsulatus]|jgi:nucleoside-diphosphate-sugar epimerase|uniref:UDP-GlcNAc 4-epimerase n=1 Tax=Rhodobacter capsulatus (strain ATCC BAA-309 / NBRC 16581 / SB1003) TaxID=272942 RepID=D5AUP1_RHOCB|nr:NAD-dependent epimerase/dehydratase family protein [Rhodobacter capsulatus]ADE85680.1 UDP-GlcNAc 4-epimerase [Rhodobacter capsulatus SB 1003]ETD01702.1 epimerase [Rhodobacter capsulatus DE442]ETD76770.1 epimerase [Rhodobacter capsulatus R121]ETE53607.1 epimerase [Rhodobacter capsulatus Y262]MDS0927411.1 NAD-dependent epimerase/dehydratase family protein [Rhodobacter capsulatus]
MRDFDPNGATQVVFGGSGFIGTHLLGRLRAAGAARIVSLDLRPPARPVAGVDYRIGDVRDLSGLTLPGPVPRIFNLAAVHTTPGHAPWEYYDANVRGAREVARFAARQGCGQIVFTSSISVYGPDEAAKDESTAPAPVSDYGRSKRIAEDLHRDWLEADPDRRLVIVRPAVVFGLGEGGNFTRLARMLEKGIFVYPGRRDTIKSCIHVADLLDWMLAAADLRERSVLFNGAYANRYTIEEIVETFRRVAFPKARTAMLPAGVLKTAAAALRPISATGLGIHPERIEKLMISTNILPLWAEAAGLATRDRLEPALRAWRAAGGGRFL